MIIWLHFSVLKFPSESKGLCPNISQHITQFCVHNFRNMCSILARALYFPNWHIWVSQSKTPVCDGLWHNWPGKSSIQLSLWGHCVPWLYGTLHLLVKITSNALSLLKITCSVILTSSSSVRVTIESGGLFLQGQSLLLLHSVLLTAFRTLMSCPYIIHAVPVFSYHINDTWPHREGQPPWADV